MKPRADQAMQQLIDEVRTTFPFDLPRANVCSDDCRGCSLKLLQFLESELDDWERRLADGERPGLAELSRLMHTSRKVGRVLEKADLMPPAERH
jgi:hypothetical protein